MDMHEIKHLNLKYHNIFNKRIGSIRTQGFKNLNSLIIKNNMQKFISNPI